MSKSLGNEFTLRDIIKKGFKPLAIRSLLLSFPFDKQLNFTKSIAPGGNRNFD